ncbi:lytic transglycosylase domain-containing protein [Rhodobacter sp. NTK016B]|uniref:lytic transglycosylase domain-containing protein n=1 Tax=Rhodobacter sp. NTK016B TaxID=2759676 RepID=UPI001A8C5501|nr:lytic transglycosylase domain-containing protein [Rhodobacter sp. NTK016B]MBN8294764.1 lytic transglycosylase domain-containing protein [Rhodobacter sp. NTK016B]
MRLLTAVLSVIAFPVAAWEGAPPPRAGGAIGALVSAVRQGDAQAFETLSEAAGPIGVRIATWRILREGIAGDMSTYAAFDAHHAHWPGMELLRARAETELADQPPEVVTGWFAARTPQTSGGLLALLRAQTALGQDTSATLRSLWLEHDLSEAIETDLLDRYGTVLTPLNADRLDAMLWDDETEATTRMLPRVTAGEAALARARIALQAREDGVNALINAVPAALQSDPGLAYDRFIWRLRRGLSDTAVDLILERSPDTLGRPQAWAGQRLRLARNAMEDGAYPTAYRLAAQHGLTDNGASMAELEWLAGYIALRFLDRPADAAQHFARLRIDSTSPITLGRAGYWEGRALDAAGDAVGARAAYEFGAQHQTAFYGQLAAEHLGLPLDAALVTPPDYPDWHETALVDSDLLQAALLLHDSGQWYEARRFTLQLAENLTTEAELGALAQLWLERGEPNFALRIAKIAVRIGVVLPAAYFPVTEMAEADLRAPADLTLAIARRESEFDFRARSHADARGLMQVMPATGAHTARRIGIAYDEERLNSDATYNAILGAAYLEEMMDQFDGTLSMVSAAYNAGPGRPTRWARDYGDPRDPDIDPVDFVEMIPFNETRNYVMRVTESVVIYRARLRGETGPIGLIDILRGRS